MSCFESKPIHIEYYRGGSSSGKTRMLLQRVSSCLEPDADLGNILVVCATRDTAEVFRRRLGYMRDVSRARLEDVRITSVRSLALRILATQEAQSFFGHGPRVLLDVERSIVMSDLRLAGFDKQRVNACLHELWHAWDHGIVPEPRPGSDTAQYLHILDALGAYDLRQVGACAYACVKAYSALRDEFGAGTVFVDDANLIGPAQLLMLEALCKDRLVMAGDTSIANPFFDAAATGDSLQSFMRQRSIEPRDMQSIYSDISEETGAQDIGAADKKVYIVKAPTPPDEYECCAKTLSFALDTIALDPRDEYVVVPSARTSGEKPIEQQAVPSDSVCKYIRAEDLVFPCDIGVVLARGSHRHPLSDALKKDRIAAVFCTESQPITADPRKPARVATLQAFTLLALCANSRDLVAWRTWMGLGRSDISCPTWAYACKQARARGCDVLDVIAEWARGVEVCVEVASEPCQETAHIEGVQLFAKRYRQAQLLLEQAHTKRGRALFDVICPGEDPVFLSLCEPIVAQTASELLAQVSLKTLDRGFGGKLWDVRVGIPQAFAGLHCKVCSVLGMNEGVVPASDLPEALQDTVCRLYRSLFVAAKRLLVLSYVQGASPDYVKQTAARVHRIKHTPQADVCMLAPSALLRRQELPPPSTMSSQQYGACMLGVRM